MANIKDFDNGNCSRLMLLVISLISCTLSMTQTVVPAGPVTGTWTLSGSPYLIMGEIGIPADAVLVIEPGVKVEFQGYYPFNVQGQILAVGSVSDTILFTIYDSTGFYNITIPDGGWQGIRFGYSIPGDDTSRISHCLFAYGKAIGDLIQDQNGGAIAAIEYPNLIISNSTFYNNAAMDHGGAVALFNSNIILENNLFFHNRSAGSGGAISIYGSDATVRNCYFIDNRATSSGGAISLYNTADGLFISNLMAGNFADFGGALQLETNCSPVIRNNLIYSNVAFEEGGGADLENNCQASFINNTITGNFALFGGGIDVEVNSSPVFHNDIIWGNTAFVDGNQVHLFSEDSDPDFYYCNIQGGADSIGTWYGGALYLNYTGTYLNNSDVDPDFITEGLSHYLLDEGSLCIDAGDPDALFNDKEDIQNPGFAMWPSRGTLRNDMGCYGGPFVLTYGIITGIRHDSWPDTANQAIILYQNNPNPVRHVTAIRYELLESGYTLLTIRDLLGREVVSLVEQTQNKGQYKVDLDVRKHSLKNGIYLYCLQFANLEICRKFVVAQP